MLNCSDARHLIHLDVGNDLRADEENQLATHMNQCADCRSYHAGMSQAMTVLGALRDSSDDIPTTGSSSVWPALSAKIRRQNTSPASVRKFNLQIAALSVCSLCLAMVTIVQSLSAFRSSQADGSYFPAQSVSQQSYSPVMQPGLQNTQQTPPQFVRPGSDQWQDNANSFVIPTNPAYGQPQSF